MSILNNLYQLYGTLKKMRAVAQSVGSLHSWWEPIADVEAFLESRPTILNYTLDEWVAYTNDLLAKSGFENVDACNNVELQGEVV